MTDEFGHWLAGFVAGEGCFCIYVPSRKHVNRPINLLFSIKLRQDDVAILQEIQRQLNCGHIFLLPKSGGSKPSAAFRVGAIEDLKNIIVPLFQKFPLLAKKARDFDIWAEAVELFWNIQQAQYERTESGGNSKWSNETREKMLELCEKLKVTRKFKECAVKPPHVPPTTSEIEYVRRMISNLDVEMIDAKHAAILAGIGRQGIERARKENRIVSAKIGRRRHKYPKWQFERQTRLAEILKTIKHRNPA